MSHYAKVVDGKVTQVIVAEAEFFNTFVDTSAGTWIQTSYNTRGGVHYGQDGKPDDGVALRGNYAGIGSIYDQANDVFYAPRPVDRNGISCASWTIGAPTWEWVNPVPVPDDVFTGTPPKRYSWDEATTSWAEIT